jgi:hypothetical protein
VTEVLVSDDDSIDGRLTNYKRKRQRSQFPWEHTREWALGDASSVKGRRQCIQCRKWFSISTNASGWKIHLFKKHGIGPPRSGIACSENSLSVRGLETDVDQEDWDEEVMQNGDLDIVNPQFDSAMFDCI